LFGAPPVSSSSSDVSSMFGGPAASAPSTSLFPAEKEKTSSLFGAAPGTPVAPFGATPAVEAKSAAPLFAAPPVAGTCYLQLVRLQCYMYFVKYIVGSPNPNPFC
jgi:hypothetical protein